jgi:GNAT superfamily N-acetyltransferase
MTSDTTLTIRPIAPADIPDLFRVRTVTDENRLTLEELAALGINEQSVAEKLRGNFKGWLCEDNGAVVGFAMGDKSTGEMWVIAVLPSHICRGIGGALLEKVDGWLFSEGCQELWLTTDIDPSLRAYTFYIKHGWEDWKMEDGMRYMKKRKGGSDVSPR